MNWFAANEALIQQICVFAILAASIQMLLNAGIFSFAPAGSWLIGAYVAAIGQREGLGTVPAMALSIAIGAVVALIVGLAMRKLTGLVLSMASLAFVLIVVVAARSGGDLTGGALGIYAITPVITTPVALALVVVVAVLLAMLERGRLGRAIHTIREDAHVADAVGVPLPWLRLSLMTASGALGALSGAMYAYLFNAISPELGGFDLVISTLSMVVIGGISSWSGAYIGAVILTWLPSVASVFETWNTAAYGAVLLIVVVLAPGGLLGVLAKATRRGREALRRRPRVEEVVS